ncbi:unnamed protein product [Scytosiphon promiscuus]
MNVKQGRARLEGRWGFKLAATIVAAAFLLALTGVDGKASAEAHPHQGKVKPYKPGMPDIKLTKKQLTDLNGGDLVQDMLKGETDEDGGKGGRALAVQDINAPAEYVWDRILDFGNYNKMVPKVTECKNYETQTLRNGTEIYKTNLKLNVFGVKLNSFFFHSYFPSKSSMTWTLDYTKKSTLDDSVGFWHVAKHPAQDKQDDWSRVYYSVQLRIPSWIPGIVIGYLNKKAIREATTWVKRESEQKYKADFAAGRTLGGKKAGLPGGWGNAFGGSKSSAGKGASSGWAPSWMKAAEPEPEPEPEVVEAEPDRRRQALRWIRRSALGVGGLCAGLALDGAIAGGGGGDGAAGAGAGGN